MTAARPSLVLFTAGIGQAAGSATSQPATSRSMLSSRMALCSRCRCEVRDGLGRPSCHECHTQLARNPPNDAATDFCWTQAECEIQIVGEVCLQRHN